MISSAKIFSRRSALIGASAAACAIMLAPRLALADAAMLTEEFKKLFGDKKPSDGKIKMDLPQIAENGLVVPVTVEIESPMTDADYVKAVHIFAESNPLPSVATFRFTPACGKAMASTRMRLSQTQNVICVAEMSNGTLYTSKTEVKVTIGGCGG